MNAIGKTLIAVVSVVETLTVSAQMSSLPIGSTNAVLQDALRQINGLMWDIGLMSKEGIYVEQFFAKQVIRTYNYERDGEPTAFLKKKLSDAINSVNWNRPEFAGRKFQTRYDGWKDLQGQDTWYSLFLFGTSNEFELERNEQGELVPPPIAYKIDLVAALMRGHDHAFFVNNIERAIVEAEVPDDKGKVMVRQDSHENRTAYEAQYIEVTQDGKVRIIELSFTSVNQRDGILWLSPIIATSGWPGRITIWYKSGVQQVFSLADGHLVPSLSIRKAVKGVELIVSSAEPFLIEASENLQKWSTLYLQPVIEPATPTFVHRFTDSADAGRRFYRLRVEGAVQQNRR